MNQLQRVELEILKEFIKVCDELSLTYYMVCGSALGAVKYKGFIPWDDDIDVAMPRDDYECFIKDGIHMLPEYLCLQNTRMEQNFPLLGSKLRDSRTTYIERGHHNIAMNHGVFIDVFPLDGYPTDRIEIKRFERKKNYFERRKEAFIDYKRTLKNTGMRSYLIWMIHKYLRVYKPWKIISAYEQLISGYQLAESEIWCNHANSPSHAEYSNKEHYGRGIWAEFEGLKVRIPEKYDEYLAQKYGDWRADIPEEQQVGHHYYVIEDLSHSYSNYIERISKYAVRIMDINE